MESVPNFTNTAKALSESLRTQVYNISGYKRPVPQAPTEVPHFTNDQCDEVLAVVPEDIWNIAY